MSLLPSAMVVDDEEELARLFMELPKGSGFNTVSFTDPLLALGHFRIVSNQYSIILTDLKMPSINGMEHAKRIKEHNSKVRILLITPLYDSEYLDADKLKEANISKVIKKPVKLRELRTQVTNLYTSI